MSSAPVRREIKKKPKSSRKNMTLLIILAMILALAVILFGIYHPFKSKRKETERHTAYQSPGVPEFRQDGTLTFIRSSSPEPLKLAIEIADNNDSREMGLMYRLAMPDTAGMLFIFPYESMRTFWMKNTHIPLDIIYLNENREIVSIHPDTQPFSTLSIPSERPAQYVLEVNAGYTGQHGIRVGDKIEYSRRGQVP